MSKKLYGAAFQIVLAAIAPSPASPFLIAGAVICLWWAILSDAKWSSTRKHGTCAVVLVLGVLVWWLLWQMARVEKEQMYSDIGAKIEQLWDRKFGGRATPQPPIEPPIAEAPNAPPAPPPRDTAREQQEQAAIQKHLTELQAVLRQDAEKLKRVAEGMLSNGTVTERFKTDAQRSDPQVSQMRKPATRARARRYPKGY